MREVQHAALRELDVEPELLRPAGYRTIMCGKWHLGYRPEFSPNAYDIDFQIEADFIGLMSPGLPGAAAALSDRVGHIMNSGDGWYGGVYVAKYTDHGSAYDRTTLVKKGASIGSGSTILANVVVGEHALVGAGSVVTRDATGAEIKQMRPGTGLVAFGSFGFADDPGDSVLVVPQVVVPVAVVLADHPHEDRPRDLILRLKRFDLCLTVFHLRL